MRWLLAGRRHIGRRRIGPQLQSAAAECGLVCLAMILSFFGRHTSAGTLAKSSPISLKGITLAQLIDIAGDQGLLARPLRLSLGALPELQLPAVLHWNLDHFVVLERHCGSRIVILDPASGRRTVSLEQAAKCFTGVALELEPGSGFTQRRREIRLPLSRFFRQARTLASSVVQAIVLSCALQVFALITPFYLQVVLDKVVTAGDEDLLILASIAFLLLSLFAALTSAFRSRVTIYLNTRLDYRWSADLFGHLIRLPWPFFERRQTGDIQSRFHSLKFIRELVASTSIAALIDGAMAVTTVIVMYLYSVQLATIAVAALLSYLLLRLATLPLARTRSLEFIVESAKTDSFFLESLRGMLPVRNFGRERTRQQMYQQQLAVTVNAGASAAQVAVWAEFGKQLIFAVSGVAIVWSGAVRILEGSFSVGMLVAFLAYKAHFSGRTAALIDAFMHYKLARNHLERLADIVEAEPEITCASQEHVVSPEIRGQIDVRDAWYRYGHNEPAVLRGLTLSIQAGEQVAITGPSGCGKSTLLKLLVGLVRPDQGEILVDGRAIAEIGLASYRRQIGVVMQNDRLLSGTLLANLSLFSPSPDIARIEECCEIAGIDGDIAGMPMGLHSLVGDMGDALSGGQKQRILLARALYRYPRILFLDEATSNLDSDRELHTVSELARLRITQVIIAHRRETIRHADRVIELR